MFGRDVIGSAGRWLGGPWPGVALLVLLAAGCGAPASGEAVPSLDKVTPSLPAVRPGETNPAGPQADEDQAGTVAAVIAHGCSTVVVRGLSEQIIAEANCMRPGAYAKLPALQTVTLDEAVFPYLRRGAVEALVRAVRRRTGRQLEINSMLRTVAQQYLLYEWYKLGRCGIKLAALPGKSHHQSGLAIDIDQPRRWRRALEREGFRWLGKRDRWHFDYRDGDDRLEGLDVEAFQRLWNRNHPGEMIGTDGDWGPSTEDAIRRAPADGFEIGAECGRDEAPAVGAGGEEGGAAGLGGGGTTTPSGSGGRGED